MTDVTTRQLPADSDPRFAFGENWSDFAGLVDPDRIAAAEISLMGMLEADDLHGRRFLDVGAGSGLLSLAARNLGASVHSFDFDRSSVAATEQVRDRYRTADKDWMVEQGSVLDRDYLRSLGTFDIVYAWGVLHHTGAMWEALDNVVGAVALGGRLFVSIYNDQGLRSRVWKRIKRHYNEAGPSRRRVIVSSASLYFGLWDVGARILRNPASAPDVGARRARGMSHRHDLVDWVGGYPFEVAKPEQVFDRLREHGFGLSRLKTCGGGLGCNEFVFQNSG